MRDTFVNTILQLAKADPNIELITGDIGYGVLKPFWEACPNQFTNAGIAEQNMISVATGMALEGKNVFVYSIGNFPTIRCLEQIRNDCAYHQADVKIVCVGGGFVYGGLGMSHQATEDLAILRALPGMTVMAPADRVEAEACVRALASCHGPAYLRLGRGGEAQIHTTLPDFQIGKALRIKDGQRVAIFSTGAIFDEVTSACEILEKKGIHPALYSFPTVKPVDRQLIESAALQYDLIVTVEEHTVIGGFGSAVSEVMAEMKKKKAFLHRIGVQDEYIPFAGSQQYLRACAGIDGKTIAASVLELLNG